MAIIYESPHFVVDAVDHPLIDRNDGGHISINPKIPVSTRQELTAVQAIELMRLTVIVGEAMTSVMNNHGVDIGRINYQDNGNWSVFAPEGPMLHIHIYGRAKSARHQLYGEALHFPHRKQFPELYNNLKPLSPVDCAALREEIIKLMQEQRYNDSMWKLVCER